jgi:hypothetical protein
MAWGNLLWMMRLSGFALCLALGSVGCAGGQSFDDGSDPLRPMGGGDDDNADDDIADDDTEDDDTRDDDTEDDDTRDDDAASGGNAGAANPENDPTRGGAGGAAGSGETASGAAGGAAGFSAGDAGASGGKPGGVGGQGSASTPSPSAPNESSGVVAITFTAAEPDRYCQSSSGELNVSIEDEDGNAFGVGLTVDSCGVRPCDSCVTNPECIVGNVYYRRVFGAGGTVYWDGFVGMASTCSSEGATVACAPRVYAEPGTYTAVYCATLGVPSDVSPNECEFTDGQECVRVEFDYPSDAAVSAEVPVSGSAQ